MKKVYVLILSMLFIALACKKDGSGVSGCKDVNSVSYNPLATSDDGSCKYPERKFRALVLEYTSTCCHYCGEWGHDTFENLITKFGQNIVPISIHRNLNTCTDPMLINALYNTFNAERPSGLPSFAINDASTMSNFSKLISTSIANDPWAATILAAKLSGDTMIVNTATTFYDNPVGDNWFGEWYINVFILENGINGNSSAGSYKQSTDHDRPDYKHNYTLRTAANANSAYGLLLANGTTANPIPENSTVKKQMKILLNNTWNYNNLKVCAVIWLKQSGTFHKYINGYMSK